MLRPIILLLLIFLSSSVKSQINIVVKPGGFLFMDGNDSICFYQKVPKDLNGEYSRCNYIHPIFGIDGKIITEDFPEDHPHQRGVFWAWHQILIDGKSVSDGWELKNFSQEVTEFEFKLQKGLGIMNTVVNWKSPLWKSGTESYMKEKTTITMYPRVGNLRRIDLDIHLEALTDHLSIGGSDDEKGYGGFSVRLKLPENVTFDNGKGMVEPLNTAVDAGNEIKVGGSFLKNGGKGGIVIWNNPANPKPSTQWILRNKASMQNAVFPGRQPVSIPFDEPLTLRYTLLVYKGDLSSKQIKRALNQFVR
jgi:hypothetical protein